MKCFIFQQGASETQINCNQIHLYETTYKPYKQNAKINKTVMELGQIGGGSGSKLNIFTAHLLCLSAQWHFPHASINKKR